MKNSPPYLYLQSISVGAAFVHEDTTLEVIESDQKLPQMLYFFDIRATRNGNWNSDGGVQASKWGDKVSNDLLMKHDPHHYQMCHGFLRWANQSTSGSQNYRSAHISPGIIARSVDPIKVAEFISLAEAKRSLDCDFLASRN